MYIGANPERLLATLTNIFLQRINGRASLSLNSPVISTRWAHFDSQPGHRLYWLKFFMVFPIFSLGIAA
jgi:hypothetical protein